MQWSHLSMTHGLYNIVPSMTHGPCNAFTPPWPMGCITLYHPWPMGHTMVSPLHDPWVVQRCTTHDPWAMQWSHHSMAHGLYNAPIVLPHSYKFTDSYSYQQIQSILQVEIYTNLFYSHVTIQSIYTLQYYQPTSQLFLACLLS